MASSSLFSNQTSLFGNAPSIFAKPEKKEGGDDDNKGQDSDGAYAAEDEPPTVALEDQTASKSPFSKVYEKEVQKFK